ncbi:MAG: hypothetical protein J5I93_04425, partial [Pirellulaceae bacterium]|nr:hypothetical protein [Pirellulaceae bacterium]
QRHGYQVDADVGNSRFRCDLAVRSAGDSHYRLGILIDHDAHYGQTDLLEREWQRPRLLEQFGWRVAHVLAKDWYDNPQRVLDEILTRLRENATDSLTTEKENSNGQENDC